MTRPSTRQGRCSSYLRIFDTAISGIPCKCAVVYYAPSVPIRITGTGFGDADPPEPAEFEFELLDRTGCPARWLERKITEDDDEDRLQREYEELKDGWHTE
ncbi:hypothetical protein DFO67_1349 [Modicisalibacter xianhensis]|uniref:Uncharacterized protein n=1 Tax=Modicisalibacter xianhensis TaxID=442341 RepID=A0A4R8FHK7_9GAMM|nr:hypothetical protein DFO67_1349 [Halomonas xianhensis]